jgi:prepilin-type N-terminal cleavage/methylation domain-containing protein
MNQARPTSGFTIIEVVLVLAIAGLIFIIAFLAVPALQRSQRDAQRKNDMGRLIGAVQGYKANHRGSLPDFATPADAAAFATTIAQGSSFEDPSGATYVFQATGGGNPTNTTNGQVAWQTGAICTTAGTFTTTGAGSKNVAFRMLLETGDTYCQSI